MSSVIRIIKHARNEGLKDSKADQEKTDQLSTREIVNTVKSWIAELEQRHRDEERRYSALIK
ncbi:MAG TPA: hypothetical protein VGJ66_03715 [Pyrinomonadaceae bacterium]|jgi:hypothetical protein